MLESWATPSPSAEDEELRAEAYSGRVVLGLGQAAEAPVRPGPGEHGLVEREVGCAEAAEQEDAVARRGCCSCVLDGEREPPGRPLHQPEQRPHAMPARDRETFGAEAWVVVVAVAGRRSRGRRS